MERRTAVGLKRSARGLTLIELLIAMVVTGTLAAVSLPAILGTANTFRLNGAVPKVVGDLRYAQSQAMAQGSLTRLHSGDDPLVGRPGRYRLERSQDGGATWEGVTAWYALASEYRGTGIASITDSAGSPAAVYEVRFNSRAASPNPGAVVYPIKIVVSGRAGLRTIQIRRTGSVAVL